LYVISLFFEISIAVALEIELLDSFGLDWDSEVLDVLVEWLELGRFKEVGVFGKFLNLIHSYQL